MEPVGATPSPQNNNATDAKPATRCQTLKNIKIGLLEPLFSWERDAPLLGCAARLEDNNVDTDKWMKTVRRHMAGAGTGKIEHALRGVVGAFDENNITYDALLKLPPGASPITGEVVTPNKLLKRRYGDCRESAILAAATLKRLGFRAVLIMDTSHVIPAIMSNDPNDGNLSGIPLQLNNKTVYLYPLELNSSTGKRSFEKAFKRAKEFAKNALKCYMGTVTDIDGNVIWFKKPEHYPSAIFSSWPLFYINEPPWTENRPSGHSVW